MAAVFTCPFCEKKYPNKSSLIGRKVRCSDCKGIFLLQGDGIAVKVVLEKRTSKNIGTGTGTAKQQVTRQLTNRSKRVNSGALSARVEKSRLSLRDAAQVVLSDVSEALEGQVSPTEKPRAPQAVEIYRRKQQARTFPLSYLWLGALAFLLGIVLLFVFFTELSPQQQVLKDFSTRVAKKYADYPLRMQAYRKRMWIYSRDGYESPPIILNIDDSKLGTCAELPWQRLVDICQENFGGMSLMPYFAIMVESEKQAMVEQLWEQYHEKFYIEGFYKRLAQRNIRYIHCRKVPALLKKSGVTELESYVVSLLLAGTSDELGSPTRDFGLISTITAQSAFLCEFRGSNGMKLVERANDYEVLGSVDFCGLVLGFSGIPGRKDEWRILDVRHGRGMEQFYDDSHNSFMTLTARVTSYINSQFRELEPEPMREVRE